LLKTDIADCESRRIDHGLICRAVWAIMTAYWTSKAPVVMVPLTGAGTGGFGEEVMELTGAVVPPPWAKVMALPAEVGVLIGGLG